MEVQALVTGIRKLYWTHPTARPSLRRATLASSKLERMWGI
jgi:hypothetical protein